MMEESDLSVHDEAFQAVEHARKKVKDQQSKFEAFFATSAQLYELMQFYPY